MIALMDYAGFARLVKKSLALNPTLQIPPHRILVTTIGQKPNETGEATVTVVGNMIPVPDVDRTVTVPLGKNRGDNVIERQVGEWVAGLLRCLQAP